jgi:hypothetical protein
VACPYFIPTVPHPLDLWPHRRSLPLGDGFAGHCGARPRQPECDDESLCLHCNIGYSECVHLPADRELDAVRFQFQTESSTVVRVLFCGERAHHPFIAGELRYDRASACWMDPLDSRLVPLANAAVCAWIGRHNHDTAAKPNTIAT